jgi:hypothetical protein
LSQFLISKNEDSYNDLVDHYNTLINTVHNGGNLFNKLASESNMNAVASVPGLGLCNQTSWEILTEDISITHYPANVGKYIDRVISFARSQDEYRPVKDRIWEEEDEEEISTARETYEALMPYLKTWKEAQFKLNGDIIHVQIKKDAGYFTLDLKDGASGAWPFTKDNLLPSDPDGTSYHEGSNTPYYACQIKLCMMCWNKKDMYFNFKGKSLPTHPKLVSIAGV